MNYRFNSLHKLRDHPELEAVHGDLGFTVAHDCVRSGDIALLSSQLQLNPRLIQLKDCWGATALHWAANFASTEAISALLAAGADVNAVCKSGEFVLFWALSSGSVACCQAIIDAGADIQLRNIFGRNVLMSCVSVDNSPEDVVELFIRSGVDLEAQDHQGSTALMLASRSASHNIIRMLLDAGASIDSQDHHGQSAMWDTIRLHRHDTLQLLIDCGASFHIMDKDGDSILVWAALYADIDTMNILKEAGIEGLPVDADSVNGYWCWFDERDAYFVGHRAPFEDEAEAFQALVNNIIPGSEPPPPIVVKTFDVPGAFPVESTDELDSSATSEGDDTED
jgi:ankyrin repeat protein